MAAVATDESSILGAICGGSVASFSFISFTGSVTLTTVAADIVGVDDFSISSVALSDGAEPVKGIFHTFLLLFVFCLFLDAPNSLISMQNLVIREETQLFFDKSQSRCFHFHYFCPLFCFFAPFLNGTLYV